MTERCTSLVCGEGSWSEEGARKFHLKRRVCKRKLSYKISRAAWPGLYLKRRLSGLHEFHSLRQLPIDVETGAILDEANSEFLRTGLGLHTLSGPGSGLSRLRKRGNQCQSKLPRRTTTEMYPAAQEAVMPRNLRGER